MHSAVAVQFQKSGIVKRNYLLGENIYGLVGNYNDTEIYEVPFHNAMIKRDVKLKAYGQLNDNPVKNKNPKTRIKEQKTTPQIFQR